MTDFVETTVIVLLRQAEKLNGQINVSTKFPLDHIYTPIKIKWSVISNIRDKSKLTDKSKEYRGTKFDRQSNKTGIRSPKSEERPSKKIKPWRRATGDHQHTHTHKAPPRAPAPVHLPKTYNKQHVAHDSRLWHPESSTTYLKIKTHD